MENNFVRMIHKFYVLVQVSLCFWLFTLKGAVVYGILPSFCVVLQLIRKLEEQEGIDVFEEFVEGYPRYKKHGALSVTMLGILGISFLGVKLLIDVNSPLALLGLLIALYMIGISLLVIIYGAYYIVYYGYGGKMLFANAFVSIYKNIALSIVLAVGLMLLGKYIIMNLVLLLTVVPFLVGYLMQYLFKKKIIK